MGSAPNDNVLALNEKQTDELRKENINDSKQKKSSTNKEIMIGKIGLFKIHKEKKIKGWIIEKFYINNENKRQK